MKASLALFLILGTTALTLCGCDQSRVAATRSEPTYSNCLLSAVASGGEMEGDDIRALCAEATAEPTYKSDNGRAVPANDFTRCYEEQKTALEKKSIAEAARLARLSCMYPEAKQEH
ncbi:MAG TPA: hypothetical protein VMG33_03810 [Steroidobacteraceae bacterium]|nr:hypothetical protein [Steroidobacteraceae bacterium]